MKRHLFFYLFLVLTLLACSWNSLPKDVLSRKKMVPILVDIHLSEAVNNQKFNISIVRDSLPEDLYLSICQKHKIDRSVIEASLLYYGKHPREYLKVYNDVLDVLSEMELKAKSDTARPPRKEKYDQSPSPSAK